MRSTSFPVYSARFVSTCGLTCRPSSINCLTLCWARGRPTDVMKLSHKIRYTQLVKIVNGYQWKKRTYNNVINALRCAFEYGYRDHLEKHNPASGLKCFRITKEDRPAVDPFSIHETEGLIRAIHLNRGEARGNYDEFRFFTGQGRRSADPHSSVRLDPKESDVEAIRRAMESSSAVPRHTREAP